jgi:hypothetical protein
MTYIIAVVLGASQTAVRHAEGFETLGGVAGRGVVANPEIAAMEVLGNGGKRG